MAVENKLINISGTIWGTGSQTVSCVRLIEQSGTLFVPVQATADGILRTTGSIA